MDYIGFVYLWTNNLNGKKYLGSHKGTEEDGYIGSGKIFKRAIKRYGFKNFTREILEYVLDDVIFLRERENYYLKFLDCCRNPEYYNLTNNSCSFDYINIYSYNEERNKQRSRHMKEWYINNEHPKGNKNKKHSEEIKTKISETTKKTFIDNGLTKMVFMFSIDGNFIKQFNSISEAAREVKTTPSNIKYCCDGKFNNMSGYMWSYTEELQVEITDIYKTNGRKRVHTPDGIFESLKEATKFYKYKSTNSIARKCRNKSIKEYYYIKEL